MFRVAVLGCGPAGLMAAQSAMECGANVGIYSRKRKSPLYGAQYLHEPIIGFSPEAWRPLHYSIQGDPADYRRKVYGRFWDGNVSPEQYSGISRAWDIRATYDALWKEWEERVMDVNIEPGGIRILLESNDLVINTIPLNLLCYYGHDFKSIPIIAAGDAPDLGINIGRMFQCPDDTVICNGEENPLWYRMSRIYGYTTVEWPHLEGRRIPITSASLVHKPLGHNCTCWPEMLCVGRFGSWTKGVLSHEAYFQTRERLQEAM